MSADVTLFRPRERRPRGDSTGDSTDDARVTPSLSPDLRRQATRRLRLVALTYAIAFFFADFFPSTLMGEMPHRMSFLSGWLPDTLSILTGLAVALWTPSPKIHWEYVVNLGLLFEVVSAYGIAFAQYWSIPQGGVSPDVYHVLTPSWVAVWTVFFSIVVPAPPGRALLAAAAAVSASPVVIGVVLQRHGLMHIYTPAMFFFHHVFPNILCVGLATVGTRVVYKLGKDVTRAQELGSYRLVERLGQGGMGEVWKASHRMLARPAAIKFIRPETIAGSNPDEATLLLKRFEREARSTASLTSTHTVSLYDYGVSESGTFYYVMELLDGVDFDQLIRRFGPMPPARLVFLLSQVCESLEEAHARGLIHRDVKPANLYACRSGTRCDFVKVLDFGLVAKNRSIATDESRLTVQQQAAGTPAYMPPEVARGEEIDGRADLYALGCVAFWLATGKPVFEGASAYEIVSKHLHATPEAPSRMGSPEMPPELDAAILRCLAKDPSQRPADARELASLLRAVPLRDRWGHEEAEAWWAAHLPAETDSRDSNPVTGSTRVTSS